LIAFPNNSGSCDQFAVLPREPCTRSQKRQRTFILALPGAVFQSTDSRPRGRSGNLCYRTAS
jgi:hypothetical protein